MNTINLIIGKVIKKTDTTNKKNKIFGNHLKSNPKFSLFTFYHIDAVDFFHNIDTIDFFFTIVCPKKLYADGVDAVKIKKKNSHQNINKSGQSEQFSH
ncbi:MAG: hypothetical protein LBT50_00120 [Prevotellaceae bacterium]|jgi:hypothetical protein|nr:hypothetical protein [Prevotellaceae bacterium]